MTALTELFFDTVYFPRSAWAVVRWWEARRPIYNLAVGTAGLATLAVVGLLGLLPPIEDALVVAALYAVLANVCYSAGPVLDLLARRLGGPDYAPVGPTLFRYGFVFSIGLTVFPIVLGVLWWSARLVFWLGRVLVG